MVSIECNALSALLAVSACGGGGDEQMTRRASVLLEPLNWNVKDIHQGE